MLRRAFPALILALFFSPLAAGSRVVLFDGTSLDDWESVGGGLWSVTADGSLLGIRDPRKPPQEEPWFNAWKARLNRSWLATDFKVLMNQAWLYTREDFSEYDLHLEWWAPSPGNSGVSIGDTTRGHYTFGSQSDLGRTPSQIAYEIQINSEYADEYSSGSIYSLVKAETGAQRVGEWNRFEIEVRQDSIVVRLNGTLVAEHRAVADRPTAGPIGLQLHDPQSLILFRDIYLEEKTD